MNKKLLIIPTIVLSSALLLTGCTSGKTEPIRQQDGFPATSSSAPSSPDSSDAASQPNGDGGYVAPPSEMDSKYRGFFMAPNTTQEEGWSYYKSIGAKTYKEDVSVRSTTMDDWNSIRSDKENFQKFDKLFGEISSDVEQSALNISSYLEKNPSATLDSIKAENGLVINRYANAGSTVVEKDSKTGFYFVVFTLKDNKSGGYGILVPQKGITPSFDPDPTK